MDLIKRITAVAALSCAAAAISPVGLRRLRLGLAGLSTFVSVWLGLAGAALGQSVTFRSTGAEQTFTVPAGVSSVDIVAVGARGGSAGASFGPGGFGGIAAAVLPVSPGQALYVEVGGNGGSGRGSAVNGAGGFNGGGRGGAGGGGGGGASDVRTSPATAADSLASRVIVAGGGGGGADSSGGGNAGAPGPGPAGGGAGSQNSGGAGGPPGGMLTSGGSPGGPGGGGNGGTGSGVFPVPAGGGGGGGLYGGGGGSSGDCLGYGQGNYCTPYDGGNGGGGSSGFAPAATSTSIRTDSSGVPSVTITYLVSATAIKASLYSQLAPAGKLGTIAEILKHGGYAAEFNTLTAGNTTISWYEVPKGAHIARPKAVLVATGTQTVTGPGSTSLTIRLIRPGRKLLKHAKQLELKRLKLTAKGTFIPAGGTSISVERKFELRG